VQRANRPAILIISHDDKALRHADVIHVLRHGRLDPPDRRTPNEQPAGVAEA
jgi:ABC-type transport system involved in cytochrome bd biosynthesis fused ATPase/permease subunit